MKKEKIQKFIKDGINDEKIRIIFFPGKSERLNRMWKNIINEYDLIKQYLDNRYIDSIDYYEILSRIHYNIDNVEKCPICGNNKRIINGFYKNGSHYLETCGNPLCVHKQTQEKTKITKFEKYGNEYYTNTEKRIKNYNNLTIEEKKIKQKQREQKLLEKYGVKNIFQLSSTKEKIKQSLIEKYGVDHPAKSDKIKQKIKQTCLNRYGIDNGAKIGSAKEKSKQTCMERYGVEYSFQSLNNKEKAKQTWIDNYGVDNPMKSKQIKEKSKQTCLGRYGVEYASVSNEVKIKVQKTMNERYGGNAPICDPNIKKQIMSKHEQKLEKEYNTKKKNKSFNTSKPEQELFLHIKNIFPDVINSYRNKEKYPFNCDFYIPSLDLYIEYQGLWTHGGHPFNESDQNDIDKLNYWKLKNTDFYKNAIYTWTQLDVKKRNIAKQNKLNYKELWNLDEAKQFIESLIK